MPHTYRREYENTESGYAITDEQLAHIFPTLTAYINFLGEYSFHDEPALATRINDLPVPEPQAEQLGLDL